MFTRGSHHAPFDERTEGSFSLDYHLEMLNDDRRVLAIKAAVQSLTDNELSFLEVGAGTGIFTKLAAMASSSCCAFEKDPTIYSLAQKFLAKEIVEGKVKLLNCDILHAQHSGRYDIVLCEMLSTWLLTEPQVQVVDFVRTNFAHKATVFIPSKVVNMMTLCFFDYERMGVSLRAPFVEFTGRRRAEAMSGSVVANEIIFGSEVSSRSTGRVTISALVDGIINSVRLSTIVQFASQSIYSNGDALVPDTVVPIKDSIIAKAGDQLEVSYQVQFGAGLKNANISCSILR